MKPIFIFALIAGTAAGSSIAQPIAEERVQFAAGTSEATIDGQINGSAIADYVLGASEGQQMHVTFSADNPSAYFNLLPDNDPAALHVGSVSGNSFDGTLPVTGDYRLRVYLMRNAARRDETASYSLRVSIDGPADAAPAGDYADGMSGGPDHWQIAGVSGGDRLNVRSGPGTSHNVVGQLVNGDVVTNLGCRMVDETKWCQIGDADRKPTGWASGQYLIEATSIGTNNASGAIPCAMSPSQPTASCNFRVSRASNGTASVWASIPSGTERYLDFREGNLVGSDPGLSFSQERRGDLNVITLGNGERYEIPDAVLYGG